ncbi:MAG: hypothetical protein ACO3N7_04700, partial [Kiritimatiellia bacterium]
LWMIRYVSPAYLLAIFALWCKESLPGRLAQIRMTEEGPTVALLSLGFILLVMLLFCGVIAKANRTWNHENLEESK